MKNAILFTVIAICLSTFFSCQKTENTVMTTATITALYPSGVQAKKLQANIKMTNVNTKQTYQSSDFVQNAITLTLQKGMYDISLEGILSITTEDGKTATHTVRGYAESVILIENQSSASLNIILMAQ
ncbi:MAG: hypothetical protein PHD21_02920 [Flavobacteriales bacterium]|nr:hypothetical protein [Flavobacteriales bacterium]